MSEKSESGRILAFDTSGPFCRAALLVGGEVAASRDEAMERGQAERLFPLLEELLAEAGTAWADLDGIGVGTGPGNFTGLRIAVAAARGLALGLGKPAVGVTGAEALAEGLAGPVVSCLKAPREQVYIALPGAEPVLATLDALPAPPEGACVVGYRAEEVAGRLALEPAAPAMPFAEAVARIAAARLAGGAAIPRPVPIYVRPPDAIPRPAP